MENMMLNQAAMVQPRGSAARGAGGAARR